MRGRDVPRYVDAVKRTTLVATAGELIEALRSGVDEIEVRGALSGLTALTLAPGVALRGGTLTFASGGLRLTSDNSLDAVTVRSPDGEVAIGNDASVADLGTLSLRDVRTTGQVLLVADDAVSAGHIRVERLHVDRADVRDRTPRPPAIGVSVLQGAFMLWNRSPDPDVALTADLLDVGAGSAGSPVRGSGVAVCGQDGGGIVRVSTLRTAEVHTDGGIAVGTPDLIGAGVSVGSGAQVAQVIDDGPVTTHGPNDMVLDNLGEVGTWIANAPITSHGPSGIGFVNFGAIDRLDVRAPIETFGVGARGFNFYAGTLRHASFHSIATHGDGSIGIQVSRPLPVLEIVGDLTTDGGEGRSLVKGVQVSLQAIALSVKPGGSIGRLTVGGQVRTAEAGVPSIEIEGEL
jgi:hypothetical protein